MNETSHIKSSSNKVLEILSVAVMFDSFYRQALLIMPSNKATIASTIKI